MKKFILLCLLVLPLAAAARVTLVKDGKPVSRIMLEKNRGKDSIAVAVLQDFVHRISGATLPIVEGTRPRRGDVFISSLAGNTLSDGTALTGDSFRISTEDGILRITGGNDKGAIYGVVTLLEKCLGVEYWAADSYSFTKSENISIPLTTFTETPSFEYRQISGGGRDRIYTLWHRLESPGEVFAQGYWVHTFNRLLPSSVYGEEHPEYYAYFNGKRNPGSASQWCLTNPEVFDIVVARLEEIFRANPDRHIISVSQNDGNFTNCQCEHCKAIDDANGGHPSGSLIWFMNKLAERFPDKQISTLAYLYSMHPPTNIKPLPNVNIMLCSIDADREVPLTDNRSGRDFVKALEGWAAISDNIFVWDYAINFDNYLSPFPNFHVLAPNMRLFKKNNTTMHHSQMNSGRGVNFAELRSWMAAKLAWDVDADPDELMRRFLNGYYGPAASYLYQYLKLQEGALLGSGDRLWIYDTPVNLKDGVLRPYLIKTYEGLFDRAEKAVADDPVLLERVHIARLPIQYSKLEIMRTDLTSDPAEMASLLDLFESRIKELGITSLNERRNSPADYCILYRERFMPPAVHSIIAGAPVRFIEPPSERYVELGNTALTDELFGGSTFGESWVGWSGKDGSLVVDMGEVKEFTKVSTDFLHQLGAWILLPKQVRYSVSDDGENFTPIGAVDFPEDREAQVKYVPAVVETTKARPFEGRYLKVDVSGLIYCPEWHYGVGHTCWFFMDEISVY